MTPQSAFGMESRIYDNVMRHYDEPYHRGRCTGRTHYHRQNNPVCGDSVQIELQITEQAIIDQAWFSAQGCVISQAAASMLVERVEGLNVAAAEQFSARDMLELFKARLTPNRQQCCLLCWQTLQQALYSPIDG